MPGNYLRLRSGRIRRANGPGGIVRQIGSCKLRDFWGKDQHITQIGTDWRSLIVNTPSYTPGAVIEAIGTVNDGGWANNNPVAMCNLSDRPLFYNGLGERTPTDSKPPFSTWTPSKGLRYFGLDAYFKGYDTPGDFDPFGAPESHYVEAADGYNKWQTRISIYMGLWHKPTDHYSNGQYIHHYLTPQLTPVKIIVDHLDRCLYAAHSTAERDELFFVFYATIDAGSVPYLILNESLDGPYAVPVTATETDLSIDSTAPTGFNLDLVHEMPLKNHPPRPMRSIAPVNGRLYGVLMKGGAHHDNGIRGPSLVGGPGGPAYNMFSYVPLERDLAAVVWSAAQSDPLGSDFLGDPLQSWPYNNIAYTPSIEQPYVVAPVPVSQDVSEVALVITNTHAYYLQEQADGVHDWVTISPIHGIGVAATLITTAHGMVWVTQRNQIVLLRPGGLAVELLSAEYQSLMIGKPTCADYILDPDQLVDRYQVWFDTGKSVCHDFLIDGPGKGYSATNHDFSAAFTTADNAGLTHHILAKTNFFTHERQPGGGIVVTDDGTEIAGRYQRNWDDFGDDDVRKEMPHLDMIGDLEVAPSLGLSPVTVEWYADFEQVAAPNRKIATGAKVTQSLTDSKWRFKLTGAHKFWYKLAFTLQGHSAENGGSATAYPEPATEGNGFRNFYGSILRLLWRLGVSENRA